MNGEHHEVAVVGSGFAGIGAALRLKKAGFEDFVLLERAGEVGGTWRDSTYPGCACDVPSHLYSFSFAPNPGWSRAFAPQDEIFDYLRRCAADGGVLPHVRLDTPVVSMTYSERRHVWDLDTANGRVTARAVVAAVGGLSEPFVPSLPGLETFEGTTFHSSAWDHSYDFTAKRVAVVGTGASSVQFVPQIQPLVSKLVLFQRTPPWVLPRRDRAISRAERLLFRRVPTAQKVARAAIYWGRESYVLGFTRHQGLMRLAQRAALRHLRRQVPDPRLRAKLTPRFTMGCKRVLLASDYYPSLCAVNVEVVNDLVEVRPHSVVAGDGSEHDVDAVVFGTGFHVTDYPAAPNIRGRGGRSLAEAWADEGMQAYKGTTVSGFPNLFLVTGPNTGLGHTSMVHMIESQLNYVLDCLGYLRSTGAVAVDVRPEAHAAFNLELAGRLRETVWNAGGCRSWYLDSKGRNTTLWPGFTYEFRRRTRRFDEAAYRVESPACASPQTEVAPGVPTGRASSDIEAGTGPARTAPGRGPRHRRSEGVGVS